MDKNAKRDAVVERLVKALKIERLRQKRSLNNVATSAGLNHTMVSRVERQQRMPTIETLLRIAGALEINLANFLARALKHFPFILLRGSAFRLRALMIPDAAGLAVRPLREGGGKKHQ